MSKLFQTYISSVFLLVSFCAADKSYALTIKNGTPASMEYLIAHPETKKVAYAFPTEGNSEAEAYTNLGGGDIYYALYDDMQIRSFNLSTKMYLGGWDLNNPKNKIDLLRGEESIGYEFLIRKIGKLGDTASDVTTVTSTAFGLRGGYTPKHGCLQRYPLRYGDINADGDTELVLNLGRDWVVFSPSKKAVIFAARWEIDDVIAEEQVAAMEWTHSAPGDAQYISAEGLDPDINEPLPARRSYAKLYFGDFDTNGKPDILMWRKAYQSRLNSDPVKGYQLIGQALVHYEEEGGVYTKKDTDEDVIKSWLTAKNLTWQKGYPDVSECPGEEGKPIPETADPLLNDPDVLQ